MLRMLRAGFEGKTERKEGHVGDISRLIDLRPYRSEIADGSVVVQVSAALNVVESADGNDAVRMALFAFDAGMVADGSYRASRTPIRTWDETSLAATISELLTLDRDPATWQRLTGELRLPANTDFLMVHLRFPAGRKKQAPAAFAGHYLDDVRLTLRRSPAK